MWKIRKVLRAELPKFEDFEYSIGPNLVLGILNSADSASINATRQFPTLLSEVFTFSAEDMVVVVACLIQLFYCRLPDGQVV